MGYETKTAYQLACERIIAPRFPKKEEKKARVIDFIEIPEFSDKADKVVGVTGYNDGGKYAEETKLIENPEEARLKIEEPPVAGIRVQEAETITMEDIMECHWSGNFLDYGGFARMNRTMVFGLSNRNVKMKIDIEPYLVHVNASTQEQLRTLANQDISPTAPKVYGVTIPSGVNHAGKRIIYTMIESSEKVHKDYSEKLNLMHEVWVATNYGKKMMQRSNVCTPIYVMPLGVDIDRYKPNSGIMNFGTATRGFKFLSVFRWSYRKGYDLLLRAFLEEFSADEDVSLIMASRNVERMEEVGPQRIVDDFNDIKSFVKKSDEDLPHVALYTKPIHEKDMPKVYCSCNAFVLISRGEGFGLPYCEAAACGLPVIASNCSGHTDFLKQDNSFLVEPDGFLEAKVGGNLSNMAKLCHFYEGQVFPDFSSTGIMQTRQHMRYIFENYKEAKEKADKLQKLIINNYTWDMAIDRVYNRLREIS